MSIIESFEGEDPEYAGIVGAFLDEVVSEAGVSLPPRTRFLAILSALIGCQGIDAFRVIASEALDSCVTPVELKEVVYQATDYLGLGRVLPFVGASNEVLRAKGMALPSESRATVMPENRLELGNACQVEIFGEGMRGAWEKCPDEREIVNRWLAANCFGDYYTRKGLSLADREMVTLCYLAAQGGCDPQVKAHAAGNLNVGNGKEFLYAVVHQILPYIGYPRSLNALACIDEAAKTAEDN